jgi:hypothetical protein
MAILETDPITRAVERNLVELSSLVAATPVQREAAAASRNYLLEQLNTGHMQKRIVDDFMIGSYARRTALTPLDDIDLVFVIDPTYWQAGHQRLLGQKPSPDKVLESFATALRRRYKQTSVRLQRRSVGLLLSKAKIDIVPAIEDSSRANWIYIPDRIENTWIQSAPQIHTLVSTRVNKANGGRLKPLVRLLKFWNNRIPRTAQLKNFAIETIATRLFNHVRIPSLFDGLELFFDFLCWRTDHGHIHDWNDSLGINISRWARKLPDIANTGSNLLQFVDWKRAQAFGAAVRVVRDALLKARRARNAATAWNHVVNRF